MPNRPAAPLNAGMMQLTWREATEDEPLRRISWNGISIWCDENNEPVALDVPPNFSIQVINYENQDDEHTIFVEPIEKLGGIAGYRFVCSCGRIGNGHHGSMNSAWTGGLQHAKDKRAAQLVASDTEADYS